MLPCTGGFEVIMFWDLCLLLNIIEVNCSDFWKEMLLLTFQMYYLMLRGTKWHKTSFIWFHYI